MNLNIYTIIFVIHNGKRLHVPVVNWLEQKLNLQITVTVPNCHWECDTSVGEG